LTLAAPPPTRHTPNYRPVTHEDPGPEWFALVDFAPKPCHTYLWMMTSDTQAMVLALANAHARVQSDTNIPLSVCLPTRPSSAKMYTWRNP